MLGVLGTSISTSTIEVTNGILPFGAATGTVTLLLIIIIITLVFITVILMRSRRKLVVNLERLKANAVEQPAIYDELDHVHNVMALKPTSSPIEMGQNAAYISFSGLKN